ncbi:MAG: hypothetical protein WKF57_17375 [Nakamurella sp.]
MWWNWYDESDGGLVRVLDGRPLTPFASSVDNGWLGAALLLVSQAEPALARHALGLTESMRWDVFCDPEAGPAGLIRNGFWLEQPPDRPSVRADHSGQGLELAYQASHYDTLVSETRIVTYLGILTGTIAPRQYFSARRDAVEYRGMRIVPGWGGSMFEELMPDLLLPEAEWAPRSWGRNHRLHVRAQREHGLDETGYGYWGFSPSSVPPDGYREFGVDALGLDPAGYRSDIGVPADGQGVGGRSRHPARRLPGDDVRARRRLRHPGPAVARFRRGRRRRFRGRDRGPVRNRCSAEPLPRPGNHPGSVLRRPARGGRDH